MPDARDEAAGNNDLVVRADARGVILYVSANCQRLGYAPEELIGRPGADFVHPDDLARFAAITARLFSGGAAGARMNREFRYLRKDGSWVWPGRPSDDPAGAGRAAWRHPQCVSRRDRAPGDGRRPARPGAASALGRRLNRRADI